ncbi:F-box/FBD/LRR-repeat protein At5g56420-like [Silene latifolia]|uniref:F-box/FBD/LRR-repeat protein At5g56420-like n=1 Tax=Silene latifolia TaxID=37657 RepID=UPI003D786831
MESMSKKSRFCKSNDGIEDRLSGLPDEVIVHILSLMPTLDAVTTMLLRRFRNLWTLVPALHFDFHRRMLWPDDEQSSIPEAFLRFACFVKNVLILHTRSTIDAFRLSIGNYQEKSTSLYLHKSISYYAYTLWLYAPPLRAWTSSPHGNFKKNIAYTRLWK